MAQLSYIPRPHFTAMHQRDKRFGSLVCHRRAGKSYSFVHEAVIRALYTPKQDARYGYIAPYRQQAKEIGWLYLKQAARPFVKSEKEIRESELRVRLVNGAWVTMYGSDNPDALRGIYLDGVILDEFGDCRPNLWHEVILPTLTDRHGWALIGGTPRGKNAFYHLNELAKNDPDWYQMTLKASNSNILPIKELDMMKKMMTEDQYAQELECSFEAAVLGTYYASLIAKLEAKGQMNKIGLYDPSQPVYATFDLGYTDSTAIWFWQIRPDGIAMVNYHEAHGKALDYYFDLLDGLGYNFKEIFLPHDAKAKTLQTGRSTVEQFLTHFKDTPTEIRLTPDLAVQQGIDAARLVMPHVYFDENCAPGVETLRGYRRKYNELTKSYSDTPLHDWAADGADSFRYFSLVTRTQLNIPAPDNVIALVDWKPKGYSLNDLWGEKENLNVRKFARMRI